MKNSLSSLFFVLIIGLLFVDIGNPNAIRQGTEGFYLLITQEMYEANDLLTPRVYGEFHWSKPPFQFWLPMPFYYLFGDNFLLWGRVSILIFSLICCFLISLWYENELKRNWHELFGLLLMPLYFIKYGRIFMMEMALAYLTTLSALFFYSYIKKQKKKSLLSGGFFGALSILVKGPVSMAMLAPPLMSFVALKDRKKIINAILFLTVTTGIGSIWFILSYVRFGDDFFHYFFIRENLGKFNSKNYPIASVIQGLIIYSFPVILLLIPIIKERGKKLLSQEINIFMMLCFCFFYFLWFLPKQKSHHYAVPAIPILILFLSYNFNEFLKGQRQKFDDIFKSLGNFLFFIGGIVLALIYFFKDSLALTNARFYLMGSFFCLGLWTHLNKTKFHKLRYIRFILPFIFLWQFLLPLGILPTVPSQVSQFLNVKSELYVSYRKPFFISESLNREVKNLPKDNLRSPEIKKGDFVFVGRPQLLNDLPQNFDLLLQWKVWKRGTNFGHVMAAIKAKDVALLQETYALIKKR